MLTIRRLEPGDADAYVALRAEMLLAAPLAFASSPGADRASDAGRMREQLASPEFVIIGACGPHGQGLVGAAGIMRESSPKRRHIASIWGVYLAPAHRGAGAAAEMLGLALAAARQWEGVSSVRLTVSETATAAKRLYERLGFRVWGVEPDALRLVAEPALPGPAEYHMALELPRRV